MFIMTPGSSTLGTNNPNHTREPTSKNPHDVLNESLRVPSLMFKLKST